MRSKLKQFSELLPSILLFLYIGNLSLQAQAIKIPYILSIDGDVEVVTFFKNPDGDTLAAGNFKGVWKDASTVKPSQGENDVFVGKWQQGRFHLILSWGGPRNDILFDVISLSNGDMLVAGSFTEKILLGQSILKTKDNSKALFLTRINEKGEVLWVSLFQGSSWKDWGELKLDEGRDELILCGNFHDNIVFDDGQTLLGVGESSVFVGMLQLSSGKINKVRTLSGNISVNQAYAVSLHIRNQSILIAGNFDRDIRVDSLTEIASTRDWDIFLVHLRRNDLGLERLLKIGGVYEQRLGTSFMDERDGTIFLSGALAGVMKIGEQTILQSQDGLSDLFILKMNFEGGLLWASLLGGENVQAPLAIFQSEDQIWLSGYSLGKLKWTGESVDLPLNSFHSFISRWTVSEGKPQSIYLFSGEGNLFPNRLRQFNKQSLWFSGVYRGKIEVKNNVLPFSTRYNSFLGYFPLTLTSNREKWEQPPIAIFPNPGTDYFHVNGLSEEGALFVFLGERLVYRQILHKGNNFIHLPPGLPAGIYLTSFKGVNGRVQSGLFLKK
jgi:hypothetical protein